MSRNLKYFILLILIMIIFLAGCKKKEDVIGDVTAPIISNIRSSVIIDSPFPPKIECLIQWDTDEPSSSQLEYGTDIKYGSGTTEDYNRVTTHSITIEDLFQRSIYHFRVISKDNSGNAACSEDNVFTTPGFVLPPPNLSPPHPDLLKNPNFLNKMQSMQKKYTYLSPGSLKYRGINQHSPLQKKVSGKYYALVILVDFSDKATQTNASLWNNLIYGTGPNTVNGYYKEVSYNNFEIDTLNMPDTLGWFRAPKTYDYYCDGKQGRGIYPKNAQCLAEDVIELADQYVDYSKYDNDNDGYVDAIFIVHSGRGAEITGSEDDIWSHQWFTSVPISVDGVKVYYYSTEAEYLYTSGDITCGVYCHEFGHLLGLPDLYDPQKCVKIVIFEDSNLTLSTIERHNIPQEISGTQTAQNVRFVSQQIKVQEYSIYRRYEIVVLLQRQMGNRTFLQMKSNKQIFLGHSQGIGLDDKNSRISTISTPFRTALLIKFCIFASKSLC